LPDVWADVAALDRGAQERLAGVLETRGADTEQQAMRRSFLASVGFPAGARVLDVGCGTGVLTRAAAALDGVAAVVGLDTAPSLLERARTLAGHVPGASFQEGDANALPFADADFDAVLFDSTLSHLRAPQTALAEAYRVLREGGRLGIFDGDYATMTVALGAADPLQACVDAMTATAVNDPWLMRRVAEVVRDCGFVVDRVGSHGFVDGAGDGYMMSVVERGADTLRAAGLIGDALAAALKDEGRRRASAGDFFGHVAYVSVVAHRPAA
jgi:SAM-dependent methyltransferase